ncbi:hypothetical protein JM946_15935 [Steroidobacter sp. S1-65]|uniref:Glycosyltransferase RgtA/B/C/D-like domain-containing protein n=2 Tax=Steroidobacter gossypii TaxID=2805490 RepID=A0ABS1WZ17_9GAMM|nr:hypothetical protein [Steroidobacter gossypii]
MSTTAPSAPRTAAERIAIVAFALVYLIVFNRTLPHGDAQRVVRQIESAELLWNPNHLLLEPIGYYFHALLTALGLALDPLASFEILSGIATLISLTIFHAALLRAGIASPATRLLCVGGLFASHTFLTLTVNQYYVIVQMPMLMGVIYYYVDFLAAARRGQSRERNLYYIGLLLAGAVGVMFNNLPLAIVAGVVVGFSGAGMRPWQPRYTLKLWASAAALGFPIFIAGYLLSGTDAAFHTWLTAYQGDASSRLNELYGLDLTVTGLIEATALVGFNALLGATLATAGLGTVLKVLAFSQPFEFIPNYGTIALSLLLAPAVVAFVMGVAWFAFRRALSEPLVRFLLAWVLVYLAFNFLWVAGDDIFWGQILPAVWMLAMLGQGVMPQVTFATGLATPSWGRRQWRRFALMAFVPALLVVNTATAVQPMSDRSFLEKQRQHAELLHPGDMEIIPGWDQRKWMQLGEEAGNVRKLVLMNMALAKEGTPEHISRAPEQIEAQLNAGGRVIVARLYDKDHDLMPWYALAEMGWPRQRIQQLLSGFCHRPVATIGDVVFHELHRCDSRPQTSTTPDKPLATATG